MPPATSASRTGDEPSPVALYPWLLAGFAPVIHLCLGDFRPAWAAALGLVLFGGGYLRVLWVGVRPGAYRSWAELAALSVLCFALVSWYGHSMWALSQLLALVWGAVLPWGRRPIAPWACLALALAFAGLALARGDGTGLAFDELWSTSLAGFVTALIFHLMQVIGELRDTRQRLADAAVENERLRFSRDLHDLLGHTLSVMVVKAQAVRRVADRPDVVAEQAADIEVIGRDALARVRHAVAGYRGRGLTAELDSARQALEDAGIGPTLRIDGEPAGPDAGYLFGWAVREGATNVIRHSRARTCVITVTPREVRVADDGRGPSASPGNGLTGLAERAAQLGGTVVSGPGGDGGFVLTVSLPE